ncbi:MAG: NAD(P)H-hydrate epimerase [Elusimicrobiota bacterium]|nr:NAD(P)H-hydrate epimerase [Elusimicrobiota bacterium]
MPQFIIPKENITGNIFRIDNPEQVKHLTKVLRIKLNEKIMLFDGESKYLVEVTELNKKYVSGEIIRRLESVKMHNFYLRLFTAMIKPARFELLLEKVTELGVDEIIPITTERSYFTNNRLGAKKYIRWKKIILSAVEQSMSDKITELKQIMSFEAAIKQLKPNELGLIAHTKTNTTLCELLSVYSSTMPVIQLFIGPEGGFTDEEIELAKSYGYRTFSLGSNTLRAETAAIVSTGIITAQYHFDSSFIRLNRSPSPERGKSYLSVTAEEMKAIDKKAIEEYGIPSIVLMENAGRKVAEVVAQFIEQNCTTWIYSPSIAVFCGSGNNAGDGLVAARFLHNWGYKLKIFLLKSPEEFKGDALTNYKIITKLNIPTERFQNEERLSKKLPSLQDYEIIIDALLGTGTKGEVSSEYHSAIETINNAKKTVIAVDIPSGLDANTGRVLGSAVKATITVTMGLPKKGLLEAKAKEFVGKLIVADIGIPKVEFSNM